MCCVHLAVLGTVGGSCIERTRAASAAPWSSFCTAWHCCCRTRPLRPSSLASGVCRHLVHAHVKLQAPWARVADARRSNNYVNKPQRLALGIAFARMLFAVVPMVAAGRGARGGALISFGQPSTWTDKNRDPGHGDVRCSLTVPLPVCLPPGQRGVGGSG